MQLKLGLVAFYLNGGLHAVSIGKPSERMSMFWTVQFFKTEFELNFGFSHIPSYYWCYGCILLMLLLIAVPLNMFYLYMFLVMH